VLTLATGVLRSAPYGQDGMPIEWTQPDGLLTDCQEFALAMKAVEKAGGQTGGRG